MFVSATQGREGGREGGSVAIVQLLHKMQRATERATSHARFRSRTAGGIAEAAAWRERFDEFFFNSAEAIRHVTTSAPGLRRDWPLQRKRTRTAAAPGGCHLIGCFYNCRFAPDGSRQSPGADVATADVVTAGLSGIVAIEATAAEALLALR